MNTAQAHVYNPSYDPTTDTAIGEDDWMSKSTKFIPSLMSPANIKKLTQHCIHNKLGDPGNAFNELGDTAAKIITQEINSMRHRNLDELYSALRARCVMPDENGLKIPLGVDVLRFPDVGEGMRSLAIEITPEMAKDWLEYHNNWNRPIGANQIQENVNNVKHDEYRPNTGQSLTFGTNWNLTDGQHRLKMVTQTGVTIKSLVTLGVTKDAVKYIDKGKKRNTADTLSILNNARVTQKMTSSWRWMAGGIQLSPAQENLIYEKMRDEIEYVEELCQGMSSKFNNGYMRAALLTAIKAGIAKDDLDVFVETLKSAETVQPHDRTVMALRDYLNRGGINKRTERTKAVMRIQRAILLHSTRQTVTQIKLPNRAYEDNIYTFPLIRIDEL